MTAPSYFVGIGASAGGLEAIESFFKHMPADSGLAFVVVQHLSPDYKSMMAELLSKHTAMPVQRAEEGMRVEANHIYLIPPKKNLSIFHGKLLLTDQEHNRGINLPIDLFLRSLAEDQGEKTVAIILSGTGSDGTRGIRAVKEAGGMIMVQDEESAKFDGMPKSAIASGLPDYILPPPEMPRQLLAFVKHPYAVKAEISDVLLSDEDGLTRIFALLRERHKVDFTYYKPSTVVRRIERRMGVRQVNDLRDYVKYLERYPNEVSTLYQELLIGVTSFFRDKEAWDLLGEQILPELFSRKEVKEVRLWSAGCSTGEEAYSLAILCREVMEGLGKAVDVKVFATDVDREAVLAAGNGVFPEGIAADLPPNLLAKYFYPKDDSFHIVRNVREMVVFAQHNLLKDPPFTKIDFISCRNLLIYLQPVLQKKVLDLFSFSLNEGGVLLLGTSETLGEAQDQYEVLHQKWKLFRSHGRRPLAHTERLAFDVGVRPLRSRGGGIGQAQLQMFEEERVLDRLARGLSGDYLPLTLVVNEAMELVHLVGDGGDFFRLPFGKLTSDVTKMAHRDLAIPVATGLQKVFKELRELAYSNIHVRHGSHTDLVQMRIRPLPCKKGQEPLAAILVEPVAPAPEVPSRSVLNYDLDKEAEQRIQDLEQELQFTRENLQATVEELETSNEELQATNEELLASNEELQSTNEELQSVNEELYTVNAEYQSKINELTDLNNDLDNLLASTQVATLFLDERLRLRRFTPPVTRILRILATDVGRPLEHITHSLVDVDLATMAHQVLDSGIGREQEVDSNDGRGYLLQFTPYQAGNHTTAGVVINFIDISAVRQAAAALRRSEQRYEMAQRAAGHGSWDWDIASGILEWSSQIEPMFGIEPGTFGGTFDAFLMNVHPDDREMVQRAVDDALEEDIPYDVEHRVRWPDGSVHWVAETGRVYRDERGRALRMVGVVQDVTERRRAEQALRAAYDELHRTKEALDGILRAAPVGIGLVKARMVMWVNDTVLTLTGFAREELEGRSARVLYPDDAEFESVGREKYAQIALRGSGSVETRWRRKDGGVVNVLLSSTPLNPADLGEGVIFTAVDLSERHELGVRRRELAGLYAILSLLHRADLPEERLFQMLVERLPALWQSPEVTGARLVLEGREWSTPGIGGACMRSPIRRREQVLGHLEVACTQAPPPGQEEYQLLGALADCIGSHLALRRSDI